MMSGEFTEIKYHISKEGVITSEREITELEKSRMRRSFDLLLYGEIQEENKED